jgi:hypothetical protein
VLGETWVNHGTLARSDARIIAKVKTTHPSRHQDGDIFSPTDVHRESAAARDSQPLVLGRSLPE